MDALAEKHGFPPDFDLAEELFERWFWWRFNVATGRLPPATVQKQSLRELASRAKAIEEALDQLPHVLRTKICESVGHQEPLDLNRLKHLAHLLRNGCLFAQKNIPASRRGARGNPELIQLLMKLYRLYRSAFGAKAPRITKADRYSGKFFAFADDVLQSFGIQKSNYGLGKAIQRAIAEVDRKDRTNPQNTAEP